MKKTKLSIAVIAILFASCSDNNRWTVRVKGYTDKPSICTYVYHSGGSAFYTDDSCNKYNVGDTIPHF